MLLEFQERMIMVEEWRSFAQKGNHVWVTNFKHSSLHKYTSTAHKDQDGAEIKSRIDLVLVKRDTLQYVQDVMVVRGMGRSLSDHYVSLVGAWIKRREVVVGTRKIRNKKLSEH